MSSDLTHQWMKTLSRRGYNPALGWVGGGLALALTTLGSMIWQQWFEGKREVNELQHYLACR